MPSLQEIHQQSYADMPFDEFAQKYHGKFYSDMPFDAFAQKAGIQPKAEPKTVYSGAILPFSQDDQGNTSFDSNAGLVGTIKRALTLPGDVVSGKVDPRSQEGVGRAFELGTLATPIGAAARAGEGVTLNSARAPVATPTAEELRTAGRAGYTAARDMGVDLAPNSVNQMARSVMGELEQDGLLSELAPATHSLLRRLAEEQPAGSVAPFGGLVAARQALNRVARQVDPVTRGPTQDAAAASRAVRTIDGFLEAPPTGSVLAGPADAASAALREANANYGAAVRSNRLDDKIEVAELRAAAANSGRNIGNTLRQRVVDILANPKLRAGYSTEEIAALEEAAMGTPTRNAARIIGNALGGGGGIGSTFMGLAGAAGGAAAGGTGGAVLGAAAPLVGMAARSAENSMTRNAVERAAELVRQRSPLYQSAEAAAPIVQSLPAGPQAAVRGGLLETLGADNPSDAGAKFINAPGPNKDYVRDMMKMAPEERADFSKGFARNLEISIANADDAKAVVNKIFSSPQARQRIEMALGSEGARKFEGEMRRKYTTGKMI